MTTISLQIILYRINNDITLVYKRTKVIQFAKFDTTKNYV